MPESPDLGDVAEAFAETALQVARAYREERRRRELAQSALAAIVEDATSDDMVRAGPELLLALARGASVLAELQS